MQPVIELSAEVVLARRQGACSTAAALARLSDEQLMSLVALERSQLAFSTLYDRHAGIAFAAALRICGERPLAEDAVQEAFLSVWRARLRYDSRRGSVRGWMLRIVHNRAIDLLRRGPRDCGEIFQQAVEEWLQARQGVESETDLREQARTLRSALNGLPAEQSSVIELAYYGGYTQTEIAGIFGVPVGTVKGRMRLGLQKLRAELGRERALA
jgi:RNA polymerase sigma-70 factor (ECF subfamily)